MAKKKGKKEKPARSARRSGRKEKQAQPSPQAESANLFAVGSRGAGFPKFGPKQMEYVQATVELLKARPLIKDREVFEELSHRFEGFKATRPRWMSYARHLVRLEGKPAPSDSGR